METDQRKEKYIEREIPIVSFLRSKTSVRNVNITQNRRHEKMFQNDKTKQNITEIKPHPKITAAAATTKSPVNLL